jgi:hypothetical protein
MNLWCQCMVPEFCFWEPIWLEDNLEEIPEVLVFCTHRHLMKFEQFPQVPDWRPVGITYLAPLQIQLGFAGIPS